jgi:hypothetical protein
VATCGVADGRDEGDGYVARVRVGHCWFGRGVDGVVIFSMMMEVVVDGVGMMAVLEVW